MDSRNVNFSIKKSQIDTHMLGLAQKLTKLDIALEGQVFHGILGLVPKKWPWMSFCLHFICIYRFQHPLLAFILLSALCS